MAGKLSCKTTPSGATIYYDEKKQAYKTPITFSGCSPGVKTIKYELTGYESATDRVEIFDDSTSYSTATLKSTAPPPEENGKIRCITTPSGADVYFNGRKQVNKTPVTLTGITPNKIHIIKFKKSGFRDTSDEWSVKPGRTIVAERILTPVMQPGYINAISDLPDVTVKMIIEGKTYSYPAPHKFAAPAGRNVVFFSKSGHKQVEHSVTIEPRQTVTLKGNPIPIIADTVLTINTLPSEVSEGDKITLTGTLTSKDGKPVIGQIHFYDKDTATADDELFENDKPLVVMSSSSTGKYSATWTAKKVDSESLIKRGTSGAQIYAAFDGTSTHNKSKSTIRNITLKEIVKEGQLRITTRPPGADVYIDGEKQEIGTSAEEFSVIKKLPFGKYTIKTEIKGFDPMEEEVEIKEGPYETIVNHIYEGAKNLCGVLGLETTELGCVRAILTLPIDLYSPFADAYIIKEHKSLYTGKPETPTKFTYLCLVLGCIGLKPVALGAKGFKASAKGAKLATLAKIDSKIETIFMDENLLGKILSMTSSKVDELIDLVIKKNYDGIRAMLKDTKAEILPVKTLDEISENAATVVGKDEAAKTTKILEDATKVAKVAFKLENQGVDLFKLARTDKKLANVLADGEFLSVATLISDDIADALITLAKQGKYDEIKDILYKIEDPIEWGKLEKESRAAIYKTRDNTVFKLLKLIDPAGDYPHILNALKISSRLPYGRLEYITDYFVEGYVLATKIEPQRLARVSTETIERITKDSVTANHLAEELGEHFPKLISKLRASKQPEANALGELLRTSRQIFLELHDDLSASAIEETVNRIAKVAYKSAVTNNLSYIKNLIKMMLDEAGNLKSIEDLSKIDLFKDIIKVREIAPLFVKRFANLFSDVADGTISKISKTDADDFLLQIEIEPKSLLDLKRALLDKDIVVDSLLDKLSVLNTPQSLSIRGVFKHSTSAKNLKITDEVTSGSAKIMKRTIEKIPDEIKEMTKSFDDAISIADSAKKTNVDEIEKYTNEGITSIIDDLSTAPSTYSTSIRNRLDETIEKISNFMKTHPERFAAVGVIAIIAAMALIVKMVNEYEKANPRPEPDTPTAISIRLNGLLEAVNAGAWNIDAACKSSNISRAKEINDNTLLVIDSFDAYLKDIKDEISESAYNEYILLRKTAIDTLESKYTCMPAEEGEEPPFPTIPTEISIKLNSDLKSIDSSIWNVKNACAVPDIESATTAYIQTIDLITAFQIYLVKVKSDIGQFTYDGYSMKLGVYQTSLSQAAKCLGADPGLDIPADDAAYLVRGILNAIDSSIFTIKAACKLGDPDELALTIIATESLFTEYDSLIATHGEKLESAGKLSAFNTELESLKTTFNLASKCPEEEPTEENIGFLIREILGAIESGIFNLKSACQRNDVAIAKEYLPTVEKLMAEYTSLRNEYESELSDAGTLSLYDSEFESYQNFLKESTYCIPAEIEVPEDGILKNIFVKEVIDGDTLECRTEDGDVFRVRMVGINTPEKKPANLAYHPVSCTETSGAESVTVACTKEVYQESVSHLWKLVDDKAVTLKMRPDRLLDTTGGRYVADVISSTDVDINLDMVKSGLACYYHREDFGPTEGDVIDHAAYIEARNAARDAKIGIWKVSKVDPNAGYAIFKAYRYKTDSDEKVAVSAEIRTTGDKFLYNSSTTKERVWDAGSHTVVFKTVNHGSKSASFKIIAGETIIVETVVELTKEEEEAAFFTPRTYGRIGVTPAVPFAPPTPPTEREPKAEPWEEFEAPMKILFLNVGKKVTKQTTISTAGQKFIDKHCDLEFEWESEDHDAVELGTDDDDCATLDDTEELTEVIEQDKVPEGTKIVYLLWNADEPKCVSYTGFTGGMDDLLFDAMLCSSPTSKSKPEFTATTGKLKNDNLKIKYEGSLTIIIQICEALHELYEKTKSDEAEELPEFDNEFCKKDITDDRPNAKCVVEWLTKFNNALPEEIKERSP